MLSFYEIAFFSADVGHVRSVNGDSLRVGGVETERISVGCARLVVTGLCFFRRFSWRCILFLIVA